MFYVYKLNGWWGGGGIFFSKIVFVNDWMGFRNVFVETDENDVTFLDFLSYIYCVGCSAAGFKVRAALSVQNNTDSLDIFCKE